ncbi:conserved hypothetical protein [Trichinella spiralis]|uniref:hypothetical protein n=1 Tax=Trichinella spiralis TaxID=6334 RepID=UPI0001EFEE7C|nr:conserved hypothetical protein [Trichinella spiralis]
MDSSLKMECLFVHGLHAPSRQRQGICRRDELKEHQTMLPTNKIDNKFNTLKTTATLKASILISKCSSTTSSSANSRKSYISGQFAVVICVHCLRECSLPEQLVIAAVTSVAVVAAAVVVVVVVVSMHFPFVAR